MIDIGLLECISLDVIVPESGAIATIVGRFTQNKPEPAETPEKYKAYRILSKEEDTSTAGKRRPKKKRGAQERVPATLLGKNESESRGDKDTYGWLLTRHEIEDESFEITDWSFYVS